MKITKVMGKCNAGVTSAWSGMKRIAGNTKQDGRIAEAESRIERLTAEIGNLTLLRLDEGLQIGDEIAERYNAILEARKEIEAAEADKDIGKNRCPHCGGKTEVGMKFCGHCGQAL